MQAPSDLQRRHETLRIVLSVALLGGLVACGGGGGGSSGDAGTSPVSAPLAAVPSSARDTEAGLVAYIRSVLGLSTAEQDAAEPIDLGTLTLPSSDTSEPSDV